MTVKATPCPPLQGLYCPKCHLLHHNCHPLTWIPINLQLCPMLHNRSLYHQQCNHKACWDCLQGTSPSFVHERFQADHHKLICCPSHYHVGAVDHQQNSLAG